jgi:hypothetical protein
MTLILDDASLDGRQLGHLMPLREACDLHVLDLLGQRMPAVLALLWQHGANFIHPLGWRQRSVCSAMAGLPAYFSSALLAPPPLSRPACQPIGGRRL